MTQKKPIITIEKGSLKKRILECLGDKKPSPWGISIGLDTGVLTRLFTQDKIPRADHLLLISQSLGKSINWLLTVNLFLVEIFL